MKRTGKPGSDLPKRDRRSPEAIAASRERAWRALRAEFPLLIQGGAHTRRQVARTYEIMASAPTPQAAREQIERETAIAMPAPPFDARFMSLAVWILETRPNIRQIGEFMRESFIPWFNSVTGDDRLCVECGTLFGRTDGRGEHAAFCSDGCSAVRRNRGREKVGGGRSAAETATRRREVRFTRHAESCATCKAGEWCAVRERIFGALDALDRFRGRSSDPDLDDPPDE